MWALQAARRLVVARSGRTAAAGRPCVTPKTYTRNVTYQCVAASSALGRARTDGAWRRVVGGTGGSGPTSRHFTSACPPELPAGVVVVELGEALTRRELYEEMVPVLQRFASQATTISRDAGLVETASAPAAMVDEVAAVADGPLANFGIRQTAIVAAGKLDGTLPQSKKAIQQALDGVRSTIGVGAVDALREFDAVQLTEYLPGHCSDLCVHARSCGEYVALLTFGAPAKLHMRPLGAALDGSDGGVERALAPGSLVLFGGGEGRWGWDFSVEPAAPGFGLGGASGGGADEQRGDADDETLPVVSMCCWKMQAPVERRVSGAFSATADPAKARSLDRGIEMVARPPISRRRFR